MLPYSRYLLPRQYQEWHQERQINMSGNRVAILHLRVVVDNLYCCIPTTQCTTASTMEKQCKGYLPMYHVSIRAPLLLRVQRFSTIDLALISRFLRFAPKKSQPISKTPMMLRGVHALGARKASTNTPPAPAKASRTKPRCRTTKRSRIYRSPTFSATSLPGLSSIGFRTTGRVRRGVQ